jgi:hypothetical protein
MGAAELTARAVVQDDHVPAAASDYAHQLLVDLGTAVQALEVGGEPRDSALRRTAPGVVAAAEGCLLALRALAPEAELPEAHDLLTRRALLEGLPEPTSVSARGATRLLPAADGLVAVSLARRSDLDLVPALVEAEASSDPWGQVASWLSGVTRAQAAQRLELLSLAYGIPGETRAELPWALHRTGPRAPRPERARVVTFAALWAGPLCAQLLRRLGCEVVKVEDPARRDGMRAGSPALYAELHEGVEIQQLPLVAPEVAELVATADIVVEGSRPRALRRAGLVAEEHAGTWVSITGHGRDSDRVAFGDDAAVSGGLLVDGCFVGDAVADPLTGAHAALAAWACHRQGGGVLVDVPLARCAAVAAGLA